MGEKTEDIKKQIIQAFPKLALDSYFELTSPYNSCYNCIAWAYNLDNRWMWPNTGGYVFLDGIHYWPSDHVLDCNVDNFIEAFSFKGYIICDGPDFEEGYRKIALYVAKGTKECTHASRQLNNGFWTSKLGKSQDIQHGTPYDIEGDSYGEVFCFMKREHK